MLLRHACDDDLGPLEQLAKSFPGSAHRLTAERLGAGIDHGLPRDGRRDDGREHGQRAVVAACTRRS